MLTLCKIRHNQDKVIRVQFVKKFLAMSVEGNFTGGSQNGLGFMGCHSHGKLIACDGVTVIKNAQNLVLNCRSVILKLVFFRMLCTSNNFLPDAISH